MKVSFWKNVQNSEIFHFLYCKNCLPKQNWKLNCLEVSYLKVLHVKNFFFFFFFTRFEISICENRFSILWLILHFLICFWRHIFLSNNSTWNIGPIITISYLSEIIVQIYGEKDCFLNCFMIIYLLHQWIWFVANYSRTKFLVQ